MEQSHILNLLIAGSDSTVPLTAAAAYIEDYADLDDGAFSVCNDQNLVLDATTVLTDTRALSYGIRLVGRYGTKLVYSDLIRADDLVSFNGLETAAAAEQFTHIGYTGAGGAIAVINDNVYKLNIKFTQIGRTGQGRSESIDVMYRSDATATATEVAFGLMENLVPTLKKQPESTIVAHLINSAALVANDRLARNLTVIQGSKYVTVATDWTTAGGVTLPVVGDLLRLGSAATATAAEQDAAVALGSTVYKIISFPSALVAELDRPVTGVSGTYTASTDASVIPIASVGDYGIRLKGVAPTWTLGKRPWQKIMFTVGLNDFGSTTVTYTSAASLGLGLENQIRDLEWFCQGESGEKYRGDYMYTPYTSRVEASGTYRQISLVWAPGSRSESIGGPGHNPKQLIIALHSTADDNDANDIVIDILNAFTGATLLATY
jgi:hypothetical protein